MWPFKKKPVTTPITTVNAKRLASENRKLIEQAQAELDAARETVAMLKRADELIRTKYGK